jgi:hypothetical protein
MAWTELVLVNVPIMASLVVPRCNSEVVESGVVVETDSDCEVTVDSGAMGAFPPAEATGLSDVVDSIGFSVVEVLMVSVGQALAVVVIFG